MNTKTTIEGYQHMDMLAKAISELRYDVAAELFRQLSYEMSPKDNKQLFRILTDNFKAVADSLQWSWNIYKPKEPAINFRCLNAEHDAWLLRQLPYAKPDGACQQQCEACKKAEQNIKEGKKDDYFD